MSGKHASAPTRPGTFALPFRSGTPSILLAMLLLLLANTGVWAAPMELRWYGDIFAGTKGTSGTTDGNASVALFRSPTAICPGLSATDTAGSGSVLYVGDGSTFRVYDHANTHVGTVFGSTQFTDTDGPYATATTNTPTGCTYASANGKQVVYFVDASGRVRWMDGAKVSSVALPKSLSTGALSDITYVAPYLYVAATTAVIRCTIGADMTPGSCEDFISPPSPHVSFSRIAVGARGVFVGEEQATLYWYSDAGALVATATVSALIADVAYSIGSDELHVLTAQQIFNVSLDSSSTMSVASFVGTDASVCAKTGGGTEGHPPVLCRLQRLLPVNENVMYTTSRMSILWNVSLPNVEVILTRPRPPFPIGYPDIDSVLDEANAAMAHAINTKLGTTGVYVAGNSSAVDPDAWTTDVTVMVPQREYDDATTVDGIKDTDQSAADAVIAAYYAKTDEWVYIDSTLFPFCNATKSMEIERTIADTARATLLYPLIYTSIPVPTSTVNISRLQLLMPSSFANDTTHTRTAAVDWNAVYLQAVNASYGPDYRYTLSFPTVEFHFNRYFTVAQEQHVRWLIYSIMEARLQTCYDEVVTTTPMITVAHEVKGEADGASTCRIGITNRTQGGHAPSPSDITDPSNYTIFLPEDNRYTAAGINITKCLDGADWDPVKKYLDDVTTESPHTSSSGQEGASHSSCSRGCVIGIATAAAVVAILIIVVVVVCTSKRRRLATVVAHESRPKFISTLDDVSTE